MEDISDSMLTYAFLILNIVYNCIGVPNVNTDVNLLSLPMPAGTLRVLNVLSQYAIT